MTEFRFPTKMTEVQCSVARVLAAAHFHQWACECDEATVGLLDINEIRRAVRADLAERGTEWEGVIAPALDVDGCVVHRTGEGHGRLSWRIFPSGRTVLHVHRPSDDGEGRVVLRGEVYWDLSERWVTRVDSYTSRPYHARHVEALMGVIRLFHEAGKISAEEVERAQAQASEFVMPNAGEAGKESV